MAEKYLKNKTILDSGYSLDIFRNTQLVMDIKISNKVINISTNTGSKINQMKAVVPDYGKVGMILMPYRINYHLRIWSKKRSHLYLTPI